MSLALAAVVVAMWPALHGALVYDDLLLVARNPALGSVSELLESLGSAHWDQADDETELRVGYWRPITMVLLFVGRALGGGETWGYHAVSLAVHLAGVVLAFGLVLRLTRSAFVAGATAALFGLHPVQVESVAWISAVNDPLAGAFTIASLWSYLRWRDGGSRGSPWLCGLWLLLGLLAKESALAWFAMAPALDAGRALREGERRWNGLVRAWTPALVALAVWYVMRVAVFEEASAGFGRITSYLASTPLRRVTLRLELLGGALQLLVWPHPLNLFREVRPEIPWNDAPFWRAAGAIALWLAAVVWSARSDRRVLLCGLLWMAAGLAPAIVRFESIGRFPLSDRFLYLSALGVALAIAGAAFRFLPRIAAVAVVAVLAAAAGWQSNERTVFWKDEETLFRSGAEASPRSTYVLWGLGRVLLQRFQRTGDIRDLLEANEAFDRSQVVALENREDSRYLVTPFDDLQASLGIGWYLVYCSLHTPQECTMDEAELVFREIARRAPRSADAHCGLGVALRYMGRFDEAETSFARATTENGKHYDAWFNLGQMQLERARWQDALGAFDKCVQLAPDSVEALVSLAMAAIELDHTDRARVALKRAIALAPEDPGVHTQIGVLAAREQRFEDALESFEAALKRDGSNGPAHLMRAKTLLFLGRPKEAVQAFLDASRWLQEPSLDPMRPQQLFEAFYNAGALLGELGQRDKAIEVLTEARNRDPDGSHREALDAALEKLRARSDSNEDDAKR